MVLVQNYALAVFLCFVAMVCWGSWQNTQNLIGKEWRFELYYWDYTIGIFLFALLIGIIVGTYSSIFVATSVVYDFSKKKVLKF